MSNIAQTSNITKWNVLALLAALLGMVITLGLDQLWLNNWFNSGQAFAIGQRATVQLPAGPTLVYYESPVAAPVGDVMLRIFDADNERLRVESLDESRTAELNYRLLLSGWSGRALWRVNIPAAGVYSVLCNNHNFMSDADIPADDRVVFLKQPDSFADVKAVRTFILVTGATVMMTAVIVFYLLHSLTLHKRRRQATVE